MMFYSDVLTRVILAIGIILTGIGLYQLYNSALRHRLLTCNLLAEFGPIRPLAFILVYFTTPTCVPCKTIQRPAIQRLSQALGNALQVID